MALDTPELILPHHQSWTHVSQILNELHSPNLFRPPFRPVLKCQLLYKNEFSQQVFVCLEKPDDGKLNNDEASTTDRNKGMAFLLFHHVF